ncbi:MAG: hypothetical protein NVS4B5_18890 [Vulcanimicrobiaceae bacterium]
MHTSDKTPDDDLAATSAAAPPHPIANADTPGVATPDQTRASGLRPDPGTLSKADTSGDLENRARRGNLTGT